ncbi:hypothetical protein [Ochrobactrum quorumnocens]|uniref:hypothetical protein n=1 Tax=Ochrobactrum quorumnocens TaxID=271865 RepID=UPI003BA20E3D|nr:hypothetical protein [Ochrobactrum sp. AN78]
MGTKGRPPTALCVIHRGSICGSPIFVGQAGLSDPLVPSLPINGGIAFAAVLLIQGILAVLARFYHHLHSHGFAGEPYDGPRGIGPVFGDIIARNSATLLQILTN